MSERHTASAAVRDSGIISLAGRLRNASGESEVSLRDALELLTPEDVAELLKVKLSWIYDQVESGRLPVLRLNRRLRFRPIDVAAFLDEAHGP